MTLLNQPLQPTVLMTTMVDNTALPPWMRVGCLAWARCNRHGHAPMTTGQIGRLLHLNVKQVSAAIDRARKRGWIDGTSTARCLVLPGRSTAPCDEVHR